MWIRWLLDSHALWLKRDLIERRGDIEAQSQALFFAPFVVVSHVDSDDPILNYGNRQALDLRMHKRSNRQSRASGNPGVGV